MSDPSNTLWSEGDRPGKDRTAGEIADEQFVHGLLEFLGKDDAGTQHDRIEQLIASIDGAKPTPRLVAARRARWPGILTAAAAVLIVVLVFGLSRRTPAGALVGAAVEASSDAGDRRYRVTAHLHAGDAAPVLTAVLDIRDREHIVMRAHLRDVALGRNERGPWIVGPDGHTVHLGGERTWPRWLGLDGGVVLLDSVDRLLAELRARYELSPKGRESLGGRGGRPLDHIVAEGSAPADADPDRIDVWIDPDTHIVHRMELRWQAPPRGHAHVHPHDPEFQPLHTAPHVLPEAPQFGPGHATAPHLMVFELVDTPAFPPGWFDAPTHGK